MSAAEMKKATDVIFDIGLKHRREVLGAEYVDKSIESANDFMMAFQHITTEWCWGYGWSREGLTRKTRSLLNLAMLASLARWHEFEVHVRGAINNGVTDDEIIEIVLQTGVYAGVPIAAEAMRRAESVVKSVRAESPGS